jgi:catechol 2,3-dioxygenase-like lactoylglutathione lyase family enzyme
MGKFELAVAIIRVSDVDRGLTFYRDQLGFGLDVDYRPTTDFRVVQLTPPGSACSIQLETSGEIADQNTMGSAHYLVVADLDAAHAVLVARGVHVGPIRHKTPTDSWAGEWAPGVDPDHGDYASFADLTDPDGNVWILQERGFRH